MKTLIIAEAGVNHNGELELAKKLIDVAASAGADLVKFQTFKADSLASKTAEMAAYQSRNLLTTESQVEMLARYELSEAMHVKLINYCNKKNIEFFSSGFDIQSIEMLLRLGLTKIKVPSGEITNLPFLRFIGALNYEVILSTGMATEAEVGSALTVLIDSGTKLEKVTVLHCTTNYPTNMSEVNLLAMQTIGKKFNVKVGYSDHTLGIEIPIAAVALGARIIEKHFTLDRRLPGPDHKASLEPNELGEMVSAIRNLETALGDGIKKPVFAELSNRNTVRKSIVAATRIEIGEVLSKENITTKRPAGGISPMLWDEIIGTKALKGYNCDEMIEP